MVSPGGKQRARARGWFERAPELGDDSGEVRVPLRAGALRGRRGSPDDPEVERQAEEEPAPGQSAAVGRDFRAEANQDKLQISSSELAGKGQVAAQREPGLQEVAPSEIHLEPRLTEGGC